MMTCPQLNEVSSVKVFGGFLKSYTHASKACHCDMQFSVFFPPQVDVSSPEKKAPVLYWLSGLTCTDQNFMTKSGALKFAAEQGLVLVASDTSPRGEGVPDDPDQGWDFGLGAGFYLNATQEPWSTHYHMYDYIVDELPQLIEAHFPVNPEKKSISGHSMGGHGALTIALKNPGVYASVSAFSPIVAATQCPWGEKAFQNYLGDDREQWNVYDACFLIQNPIDPQAPQLKLLIDQGDADGFLEGQLKTQKIVDACQAMDHPLSLRMRKGYDHSYYFISTFIEEHIQFHTQALTG